MNINSRTNHDEKEINIFLAYQPQANDINYNDSSVHRSP